MKCFLILPNQLFDIKHLKKYSDHKFILIEEPLLFGDKRRIKNFSKLKLVLHYCLIDLDFIWYDNDIFHLILTSSIPF